MLEGIEWLKWLIGGVFFLLGMFMGWWQWSYRRKMARCTNPPELSLRDPEVEPLSGRTPETPASEEPDREQLAAGDFGPVYDSEPDEIDDLQKIGGIGKALQAKLYSLGIYKFEQIANWNESRIGTNRRPPRSQKSFIWKMKSSAMSGSRRQSRSKSKNLSPACYYVNLVLISLK